MISLLDGSVFDDYDTRVLCILIMLSAELHEHF